MPQPARPPAISSGVRSFLLGEELLLFSPQAQALFRLNPSAGFIWSCCEEGLDHPAIVREMVQAFGVSPSQAERDLATVLAEWTDHGLLANAEPSAAAVASEKAPEPLPHPRQRPAEFPAERRYRLLDTGFRLRFSETGLLPFADAALRHLEADLGAAADITLELHKDTGGYFLSQHGEVIAWCRHEEQLTPLLHGQIVVNAYRRADCLIALHAAAVGNGHDCLVLPAVSGSGKSTLTAALVASGFGYCTDELALLQAGTHEVVAVPAAIGLKSGSWEVLQAFHPRLGELPVHQRMDGQAVRYLLPEKARLAGDGAGHHAIRALVFPSYREGAEPRLQRLTPADALCRLTEAGTDMEGGLDSGRVTELIDWIAGMDSYELRYDALEDAIARIRSLLT